MKFTITAAAAFFAGLAVAAPGVKQARDSTQYVTLTYSSPDGNYTVDVPINKGSVAIDSTLSFCHVDSSSPIPSSVCNSISVDQTVIDDETVTELIGTDSKDISPSRQETYAYCYST